MIQITEIIEGFTQEIGGGKPVSTQSVNEEKALKLQMSAEELAVFGYSIGQWLMDNGYSKIIVYSRKEYSSYFRNIVLQLKTTPGLFIEGFYSKEAFKIEFLDKRYFRPVSFKELTRKHIKPGRIVLTLLPEKDKALSEMIGVNGGVCLDLKKVNADARVYVYHTRPLLSFLKHASEYHLRIITYAFPKFPTHSLSKGEELSKTLNIRIEEIRKILNEKRPLPEYTNNREVFDCGPEILAELLAVPESYYTEKGIRRFFDKEGYIGIADGHRKTEFQPQNAKKRIFVAGGCRAFGTGALDVNTIASVLQCHINSDRDNEFRVENYGSFLTGKREDQYIGLYGLPIMEGDLILVQAPQIPLFPHIDLSKLFEHPHDFGEVFIDKAHPNSNGYRQIGGALFDALKAADYYSDYQAYWDRQAEVDPSLPRNFFGIPEHTGRTDGASGFIGESYHQELVAYQHMLRETRDKVEGRVGAIVVNGNPFTLGHRYLIETSAKKVRRLYVFVVEEDRSVFSFADRIEMIRRGTEDISNIAILPSGRFILSSLTFSGYFNKAEIQDQVVDATLDIELFAREIAPVLGINVRFAGEEPLDMVTRQYNETMARILPRYGIDFDVIKRKEENGKPISASFIRELLTNGDWEGIEGLVPKSTFDYLINEWQGFEDLALSDNNLFLSNYRKNKPQLGISGRVSHVRVFP